LGQASFNSVNQQAVISLNQVFLFNKLGYNHYLSTPELYLEIDFANLIKTCSHELAHYIQYVKYGQSSCKSDLETDKYVEKPRTPRTYEGNL
jgi:predicted SprT family Zn-dependent metalloprotease